MWGAAGAKLASRGFILHAALAASCCLSSASLLAYSCWRRCCYTRRAAALTAAALLQAHAVAAAVCLSGFQLMAGRHSDNFFRFMFINLLHHMGAFQVTG